MGELPPELQQCMRFCPSKEQAICILLWKITGNRNKLSSFFECQTSMSDPWDLKTWLDSCGIKMGGYPEWWFFSPPERNTKGSRARATVSGFWKVTTVKKEITLEPGLTGEKNILVFYEGRGKGKKTNWKILEYSIPDQNAFVLCRLSCEDEKSIKDPNINDARPDVSYSSASKNVFEEILKPELSLASVPFPASDLHPLTKPEKCDETLYATGTSVKCDDKHLSAHSAETQSGELTIANDDWQMDEMIIEQQQKVACDVLMPSTSLPNNYTVSSATTAKSSIEELDFMEGLDMASPEKYFGLKTMNNIGLNSSNQNSSNACAARNEVPEATTSKFEDVISLFDLPSEPPDCYLSSDQNSYNAYVAQNEVPEASATEVRDSFQQANDNRSKEPEASAPHQSAMERTWSRPREGQIKANWDAATNSTTHTSGFGGIVRDSAGEVLASFASSYSSLLDPTTAEAMSLRKALQVCQDLGLSNVTFEGDCLHVVQMVHDFKANDVLIGPILFDIQCLLHCNQG